MISFVITTHGSAEDLHALVASLRTQREYDLANRAGRYILDYPLEFILTVDGEYKGRLPKLTPLENAYYVIQENRKKGGVGHSTRSPGIEKARGDYIILTNSDNLFFCGFLNFFINSVDHHKGPDMLMWDCVNNLWGWKSKESEIKRGKIDLSCVAVKGEIAKKVSFPYTNYDGDFDYIEACSKLAKSVVHIPRTLCVHN